MEEQDEQRLRHLGIRPSAEMIRESVRLYETGWTLQEIGEKFNRSASNIWVWINKFAIELDDPAMIEKRKRNDAKRERAMRRFGITAPEDKPQESKVTPKSDIRNEANIDSPGEAELKARIARLERELEDARLMRDFYNEMIDIAEKDFKIPIRKKGGAKR